MSPTLSDIHVADVDTRLLFAVGRHVQHLKDQREIWIYEQFARPDSDLTFDDAAALWPDLHMSAAVLINTWDEDQETKIRALRRRLRNGDPPTLPVRGT